MTVARCTDDSGPQLREHASRDLVELVGGQKVGDVTECNHPGYRQRGRHALPAGVIGTTKVRPQDRLGAAPAVSPVRGPSNSCSERRAATVGDGRRQTSNELKNHVSPVRSWASAQNEKRHNFDDRARTGHARGPRNHCSSLMSQRSYSLSLTSRTYVAFAVPREKDLEQLFGWTTDHPVGTFGGTRLGERNFRVVSNDGQRLHLLVIPLAAFVAYAVMVMVANRWVAKAQLRYIALYIERGPPGPTKAKLEQMGRPQSGLTGLLQIAGWSAAGMKAFTDRQSDPFLEDARRRYFFRRRVIFIVFVVGFLMFFVVAALAR
jgi:hypothetical protein